MQTSKIPRFQNRSGEAVDSQDPARELFYSAGCTYWTDDWTKLGLVMGRIPCCPSCGSVGYQTNARDWFSGATKHEAAGHPRYRIVLNRTKEVCHGRGIGMAALYEREKNGPRSDGT